MPMYEFECEKCRKHFTLQHTFSEYDEHKKEKCPKCGSTKVRQLVASIHLKTSKKS